MERPLTPKEEKKEKQRKKRQMQKEREIRKFCNELSEENLLFRFMKKFSMNESMALKTLGEYHIRLTKKQIDYARKKKKEIRLNNKRKSEAKKERKRKALQEEEFQTYKDEIYQNFAETGEIGTLDDYQIIKEEFF